MDSAVDAAYVFALSVTVSLPAPLMQERDIIPCVRQRIRTSLLTEFDGDAMRFEDFFCRLVAEVSPPLIRCSRVAEKSTIWFPLKGNREVIRDFPTGNRKS